MIQQDLSYATHVFDTWWFQRRNVYTMQAGSIMVFLRWVLSSLSLRSTQPV